MPSVSKAQQSAMGVAYAAKKGKIPMSKAKGPAKSIAKSMTKGQIKDFAGTPSKGLPAKKGATPAKGPTAGAKPPMHNRMKSC
jgi:hypothetical protein